MRLPTLLPHLGPHHVQGEVDRVVAGISNDSRQITESDIFVAIQGAQSDGRRFVPGLRCAAVICEGPVQAEPGACVITVPDARLALARAAAALAGWPAQTLPVVGITGSNGKTTTTLLLEALGQGLGWTSAILGTTGNRIAGHHRPSAHTTPEAPIIHGILREAADAGCAFAAMEVSSIGLHLRRADAIPYRVAVFTSFSRDHLDFHGTMDAYFAAKARLFSDLVAEDGVAVLNGDDPASARLRPRCATTWRTRVDGEGDIVARRIEQDLRGSRAWVESPRGAGWLDLPLLGSFNIENALLALGAGLALGAPSTGPWRPPPPAGAGPPGAGGRRQAGPRRHCSRRLCT